MTTPKVLLDSNVWRYIADFGDLASLEQTCGASGIEIVVAPALVFEARGLLDDVTRKKILALLSLPAWARLMPEAYLEAEEVKAIVRRHRPEWVIANPDLTEVNRLRHDWQSPDGFWARAANDTALRVTDESVRNDREHELARQESKDIRQRVVGRKESLPSNLHLRGVVYPLPPEAPGGEERFVEYWRVPSLHHLREELAIYTSPYREWLDAEIDVAALISSTDSMTRLWFVEIGIEEAPRQWTRGAFECLQAYHKVTAGTPGDSQLSSHLVDVDAVVSADRNFVRFAQKCREDAPFALAQPYLICGGPDSVTELLELLGKIGDGSTSAMQPALP
jgi:hypothetical protein